jgi:hypothetical protein
MTVNTVHSVNSIFQYTVCILDQENDEDNDS